MLHQDPGEPQARSEGAECQISGLKDQHPAQQEEQREDAGILGFGVMDARDTVARVLAEGCAGEENWPEIKDPAIATLAEFPSDAPSPAGRSVGV